MTDEQRYRELCVLIAWREGVVTDAEAWAVVEQPGGTLGQRLAAAVRDGEVYAGVKPETWK